MKKCIINEMKWKEKWKWNDNNEKWKILMKIMKW